MKIKINTCRYVHASDLFKRLGTLWEEFGGSEPDFSWGDNNHTLVDPKAIMDHIDGSARFEHPRQVEALRRRVEKLSGDVYVDLEN